MSKATFVNTSHRLAAPAPRAGAWAMAALTCLALGACATQEGYVVSGSPQTRSYELRGPTVQALEAEAARRCPQGYEVHRVAGRHQRLEGGNIATRGWNMAMAYLDDDDNRAQMAITCR